MPPHKIKRPSISSFTDMPHRGIIQRLPPLIRETALLMRIDRPIGTWLLMMPAFCGLAMAGGGANHPLLYLKLALGAFLMRSAGCIVNDMWDARFDKKINRTRHRPLAAGTLSHRYALSLLLILLALALLLVLTLPMRTITTAIILCPLVILYPLAKRIFSCPQVALGFIFNGGIFIGWSLLKSDFPLSLWLLYGGCVLLTIIYDSFYASMDKDDDKRLRLGSTALYFSNLFRPLTIATIIAYICFDAAVVARAIPFAFASPQAMVAHLSFILMAMHGLKLTTILKKQTTELESLRAFRSHGAILFLLWAVIFLTIPVL